MTKINNQQGFAHVLGLGLGVLVIAGIGFTGYTVMNAQQDKKQLNSSDQVVVVKESLPVSLDGLLEISAVKELAVKSSTATVTGLELESEDGVLVYEIMLSDGTVLVLNAKTGEVLRTTVGPVINNDDDGDSLPADFTSKVTFEQARATAQAKFPDSKINKIELDLEGGIVVISVRFADKARVDVNAATGEIARTKNPKGVETVGDKKKDTSSKADAGKVDEQDAPDAPDTDDFDIEADEADEVDMPDQPDQPDSPDTNTDSGSGSSDSGSGSSGSDSDSSGSGSSGRRG